MLLLGIVAVRSAQAQTYTVIHNFTGGAGGEAPFFGLSIDAAGNLYGTTLVGGNPGCSFSTGCGTVFRLARKNSNWIFAPLYAFQGGEDGGLPYAPVTIGPDGALYGDTLEGGAPCSLTDYGCGVVFRLAPPATSCKTALCPWRETVLHTFSDSPDGALPVSNLIFDSAGSLYGTTVNGGSGCGIVYKLVPSGSGWMESILYSFLGNEGCAPWGGVLFDRAGNLYGTTADGGYTGGSCSPEGCGSVFQLTPSPGGWTESTLHLFDDLDGNFPSSSLVADNAGNLYGDTNSGGPGGGGGGTVFQLAPSGGSWTFSMIHYFTGYYQEGAWGTLLLDQAGNVYGTVQAGGQYNCGQVFKLTPSGAGWIYSSLHDFYSSDGCIPRSNLVLDAQNNLYGVTESGGTYGLGVVFQIAP